MAAGIASRDAVVARVSEITEGVGAPENIEVVDVEFKGSGKSRLLRIYIDKPGGVSHADCEFISKNVGTILDVEDVVPGGSYHLEVSSPGVERPLKKAKDFERFVGHPVKIVLREPVADQRSWQGTLADFSSGRITVRPASGAPVMFHLSQVERANLKFEW